MSFNVSAVQLNSSHSFTENKESIEKQLERLFQIQKSDLVLLPENALRLGLSAKEMLQTAEPFGEGETQELMKNLAKRYCCYLGLGSIYLKGTDGKVFKSLLLFDPEGKCSARYDKMHMFDVCLHNGEKHFESEVTLKGAEPVVAKTALANFGLSICYDLRFPELFAALKKKGAQVILMPAAFTKYTGEAHWMSLLRARAIETQCFFIAANQWGKHFNQRETYGHSAIISPWGEVMALKENGVGTVTACIDLSEIKKCEAQIPCFEHKNGYFSNE